MPRAQAAADCEAIFARERRADGLLLGSTGFAFEAPWRASTGYVLAKDA